MRIRPVIVVLVLAFSSAPPGATTKYLVSPGEDLFGILESLVAGDEVVVAAGTYSAQTIGGSWLRDVTWPGTVTQPIVIRAADGARPILQGDPAGSQNVLNIDGSYFTLRGFEITGGSHGLRLGDVDHSTFEDLVIHGTYDVGVSCNRPMHLCDRITVRRTEIYDTGQTGTGEGMYLGCNAAACTVRDSLFEYNFIHEHGGDQGDGIEIKTGSYGNVVRHNVIVDSIYPAITMYGFTDGLGARNLLGAGNPAAAALFDFNGRPRDDGAPDAGAYERVTPDNPGWPLAAGSKDEIFGVIFRDGFASGDLTAWSSATP